MPQRQNYSYQRFQRETAKAAKREAKREQRASRGPDDAPDADDNITQALDAAAPTAAHDDGAAGRAEA